MSTRESVVFTRLRERILRPGDRFERVENGLVDGMPDVNYCFAGCEGWIELKAPIEPARPSTPLFGSNHDVSVAQRNWFLAQRLARGRAWLFVATKQRLLLIDSRLASEARVNKLSAEELWALARWCATPPVREPLAWGGLREALCEEFR